MVDRSQTAVAMKFVGVLPQSEQHSRVRAMRQLYEHL
jgi:hypothetical protein